MLSDDVRSKTMQRIQKQFSSSYHTKCPTTHILPQWKEASRNFIKVGATIIRSDTLLTSDIFQLKCSLNMSFSFPNIYPSNNPEQPCPLISMFCF